MTQISAANSTLLSDLSPYIYGTTRLGDDHLPFDERVKVARTAMDAGVWFHTSHTYGNALDVLRTAFDQDRANIPRLIIKVGWSSVDELRHVIQQNLGPLGLNSLDIGQLCMGGELARQFATGGECYKVFARFKEEGLVRQFVVEVFPWTSETALRAIESGYIEGIIDGYIFYLNPLQRFATNELWDLLLERNEAVIAMRTVSGGPVYYLRDEPGYAWKPYLRERAAKVAPLFERSGLESWTEFCVRFAHSFPQVRATVGATGSLSHLEDFLTAANHVEPLPEDIINEISLLHARWSNELDIYAEPWTM